MDANQRMEEWLSLWRRSLEEGIRAWKALLGQSSAPDLTQLWGPMFGQLTEAWTRALQLGGTSPEVLQHWKVLTDAAVDAWGQAITKVMETEEFAALMGKSLDEYLRLAGPLRKTLAAASEEFLRTMNLPSRTQTTALASQLVAVDARLETIEERLDTIAARLQEKRPRPSRRTTAAQSRKSGKGAAGKPQTRR